jgi:hypothetical protein
MKEPQSSITRLARMSALVALATFGEILFLTPQLSWAQANSATFYGTVIDPSGAVIPNAEVTLTDEATQATMKKTTASSGDFVFTFVPVGTYTLKIVAKGFSVFANTGIALGAGQQIKQTYHLQLGSVAQTVSVQGGAPLVNTVSAQQLHSYSLRDARQLPLQNRNFAGLLKIDAGAVPSQGNNATGNSGGNNPGVYQGPTWLT